MSENKNENEIKNGLNENESKKERMGRQWVCVDDGTVTLNEDEKRDDDKIPLAVIQISGHIPAINASELHVRSHVNESKLHGHGHLNDRYSNHYQRPTTN